MAGKDLRTEFENYSKVYGEILVGIHNDLIDYKNKVNTYSEEFNNILSKSNDLLIYTECVNDNTIETVKKIEKSELNIANQLKEIKNKINGYQDYLKNYETELERKKDLLNKYRDDFKKWVEFTKKLSLENLSIKKSIESLETRLSTTESSLNKAEQSIEALHNKLSTTESSLNKAEQSIESLETRLSTTESSLNKAEQSIESLETRLSTTESSLNKAEKSIQTLSKYQKAFIIIFCFIFILFIINFLR